MIAPPTVQETKVYSPASVGKGYLRQLGVTPILGRRPDFDPDVLGAAMTAFYGGRAECHIRRFLMAVVYLDFLSMYPTVNALMQNWALLICARVTMHETTAQVQRLLNQITLEECFKPRMWKGLLTLVWLRPDGDVLPVRARYTPGSLNYDIGVNHLQSDGTVCYMLADVIASKLLSGGVPVIERAVQLRPRGQSRGLRKVELAGGVPVDPRTSDLFRVLIEERKRVQGQTTLTAYEMKRLDKFLKVVANSSSYGIFAEFIREEGRSGDRAEVSVQGLSGPFTARVSSPERPGGFCFPPLAASLTAGARLMLAMLERALADQGGCYVMCDTDSMAIVATERGGKVRCPGGPHLLDDGSAAVMALSWEQVDLIREKFSALNPYDPKAVGGSVLKLEKHNYHPKTKRQRQLYAYAISSKRYALFNLSPTGKVVLRKWSEHGLGHLLNPEEHVHEPA